MKEILVGILFCGVVLAAVWYGPNWWRSARESRVDQPSIAALREAQVAPTPTRDEAVSNESETKDDAPAPSNDTKGKNAQSTTSSADQTVNKAKVQVKVLNGGAPTGSAGKVAKVLQVAGFTLAKGGDAKGDYTGISVYYLNGHQSEASAIKTGLGTDGSSATLQLAADPKQETGSADVVVVLGK